MYTFEKFHFYIQGWTISHESQIEQSTLYFTEKTSIYLNV